jgi:GABA permease
LVKRRKEHAMSTILVIANETVESPILREAIRATAKGGDGAEVVIVAPALNSRARHWVSDEGEARLRAKRRLEGCLASLTAVGIEARGWIGDADPLQAIADALHFVSAGQIVIATHPEGRSNWLARRLVPRARRRFTIPILHVVVDQATGEEYLQAA